MDILNPDICFKSSVKNSDTIVTRLANSKLAIAS